MSYSNLYEGADRTQALPEFKGFGEEHGLDGIDFSFKRLARGIGRGVGKVGKAGFRVATTPARLSVRAARKAGRLAGKLGKKRRSGGGPSSATPDEDLGPAEPEGGGDEEGDFEDDPEGGGGGDEGGGDADGGGDEEGIDGIAAMGFSFKKLVKGIGKGIGKAGKAVGKGALAVGKVGVSAGKSVAGRALSNYLGPAPTAAPAAAALSLAPGGFNLKSPWVIGGAAAVGGLVLLMATRKKGAS